MKRGLVGAVLLVIFLTGCAAHVHTIGNGARGGATVQQRQWYVLWGLAPLNQVDTQVMAGGAADYQIRTEQTVIDVLIAAVLGMVSVTSRTVTVTK